VEKTVPNSPIPRDEPEGLSNHVYIQTQNIVLSSYLSLTIAIIT
jgi:hypothetical protein